MSGDALASVGAWDAPVFDLARQFRAADAVVVAAPYRGFELSGGPAHLYGVISPPTVFYHYEADSCHGDCRGQWLVYLTSGGDFEHEDSVGRGPLAADGGHVRNSQV